VNTNTRIPVCVCHIASELAPHFQEVSHTHGNVVYLPIFNFERLMCQWCSPVSEALIKSIIPVKNVAIINHDASYGPNCFPTPPQIPILRYRAPAPQRDCVWKQGPKRRKLF
jgi:hypothetical protein